MIRFIFLQSLIIVSTFSFAICDENLYCEDGTRCPANNTCCWTTRGYSCCPFKNGLCCGDDFHCCSGGDKCDLIKKLCIDEKGETRLLTEMAQLVSYTKEDGMNYIIIARMT